MRPSLYIQNVIAKLGFTIVLNGLNYLKMIMFGLEAFGEKDKEYSVACAHCTVFTGSNYFYVFADISKKWHILTMFIQTTEAMSKISLKAIWRSMRSNMLVPIDSTSTSGASREVLEQGLNHLRPSNILPGSEMQILGVPLFGAYYSVDAMSIL